MFTGVGDHSPRARGAGLACRRPWSLITSCGPTQATPCPTPALGSHYLVHNCSHLGHPCPTPGHVPQYQTSGGGHAASALLCFRRPLLSLPTFHSRLTASTSPNSQGLVGSLHHPSTHPFTIHSPIHPPIHLPSLHPSTIHQSIHPPIHPSTGTMACLPRQAQGTPLKTVSFLTWLSV
jgi:hypothetical protein